MRTKCVKGFSTRFGILSPLIRPFRLLYLPYFYKIRLTNAKGGEYKKKDERVRLIFVSQFFYGGML